MVQSSLNRVASLPPPLSALRYSTFYSLNCFEGQYFCQSLHMWNIRDCLPSAHAEPLYKEQPFWIYSKVSFIRRFSLFHLVSISLPSLQKALSSTHGQGLAPVLWHTLDVWQCVSTGNEALGEATADLLKCSTDFDCSRWYVCCVTVCIVERDIFVRFINQEYFTSIMKAPRVLMPRWKVATRSYNVNSKREMIDNDGC